MILSENRYPISGIMRSRGRQDLPTIGHCNAMVVGRKGRRRSHELQTTPSSKDSAMTIASFAGLPLRPLRSVLLAASLALLIISSGAVYAQDKDPVVAKVDGVEIRQSD